MKTWKKKMYTKQHATNNLRVREKERVGREERAGDPAVL
jgi:hypothetical protein